MNKYPFPGRKWKFKHTQVEKLNFVILMRLCHPPDGSTSPKYKLLCLITTKSFLQREVRTSF